MDKKTFRKEERLCSKRSIDDLFHNGSSFVLYPFRVVFNQPPVDSTSMTTLVKVLFSVPKRKIKKAVTRNRVKRKLRECFRDHKSISLEYFYSQGLPLHVAVQYIPTEILDYRTLHEKMAEALAKLCLVYDRIYLGEDH